MMYKLIISLLIMPMLLVGMWRDQETYHTKSVWDVMDVAEAIKEDYVDIDNNQSILWCFNSATPLRNWRHHEHQYLVIVLCNLLGATENERYEYLDIVDYVHGTLTKDPTTVPHVSKNREIVFSTSATPYELKKYTELSIPYEKSKMRITDLITTLYWHHHISRTLINREKLPILTNSPAYKSISAIKIDYNTANDSDSSTDSYFDSEPSDYMFTGSKKSLLPF